MLLRSRNFDGWFGNIPHSITIFPHRTWKRIPWHFKTYWKTAHATHNLNKWINALLLSELQQNSYFGDEHTNTVFKMLQEWTLAHTLPCFIHCGESAPQGLIKFRIIMVLDLLTSSHAFVLQHFAYLNTFFSPTRVSFINFNVKPDWSSPPFFVFCICFLGCVAKRKSTLFIYLSFGFLSCSLSICWWGWFPANTAADSEKSTKKAQSLQPRKQRPRFESRCCFISTHGIRS